VKLKELGLDDVLIVCDEPDEHLYLAARNLYSVAVCDADQADPVSLIGFDKVLITVPALQKIEEKLA
jgi:large subunit ribosomal protein L4